MKAFPTTIKNYDEDVSGDCSGMDLRDYFAAKAMQGLLANPKLQEVILKSGGAKSGFIEESAFAFADAMMKARNEQ
jgi:hypothetical protein